MHVLATADWQTGKLLSGLSVHARECEAGLESVPIGVRKPSVAQPHKFVVCIYHKNVRLAWNQCILVLKKAQPHILSQVCGVYVSYECEAGLELCMLKSPASHSMSGLWCVCVTYSTTTVQPTFLYT